MDDQPQPKRSKKHHTKAATGIGGMLRKDISRLLQLPQEVLEHVFIASENLSLPLVNHELRRRLSTDSIKYQLVGAAFGPTWDAWYGIDNYELHSYFSWGVDVERIEGNPAFQVSQRFHRPPDHPSLTTDISISPLYLPAPGQSSTCYSMHLTYGSGSTPAGAPTSPFPGSMRSVLRKPPNQAASTSRRTTL